MPATRVYIDGFNLYYGIIRENRFHWLDLEEFARRLNDGDAVDRVIYCTAMVSSTLDDPHKAQRQDVYHRALRVACPTVDILYGRFQRQNKYHPVAGCGVSPTCAVRVTTREEKGSDVNLASHLLHDAHLNLYDRAIVVSGDSDLVEPVRLVVSKVGKEVIVRNPRSVSSTEFGKVASRYSDIKPEILEASQLPDPVEKGGKRYTKPVEWSLPRKSALRTVVNSAACWEPGCTKTVESCRWK